jgi:hypothetical protein
MRVLRPSSDAIGLPVVNQKFRGLAVEQPILVRPSAHPPRRRRIGRFVGNDGVLVTEIEEKSARPACLGRQGYWLGRATEGDGVEDIWLVAFGLREQALRGHTISDRSQRLQKSFGPRS